jgi:hypothetical protein
VRDELALKPPYSEIPSLMSTVSGTSTPMLRLDGDDWVGSVGVLVSTVSDWRVASAEDNDGLLKPIERVLAGTVA